MKKIMKVCAFILSAIMLITPVFAADMQDTGANSNEITISFRLGESTLKINGADVTVQTPYAVDGTTLVPLRVITEAFGAKVDWDGDNNEITLTYSEVKMVMHLGDKICYINSQPIEMLQAPFAIDGSTMVPLRFITENFGADVTYDNETQAINVTKYVTESNSIKDYALILKQSNKDAVGDSYWNWSVNMPSDMTLSYRSFDGKHSYYKDVDSETYLDIDIYTHFEEDNMTFDKLMADMKDYAKGYTLITHEKRTLSDGNDYVCTQYKSNNDFYYVISTLTDKYIYEVWFYSYDDISSSKKDRLIQIVDSFKLDFDKETVEDLSDVTADGYRTYENRDMKLSLKIPATHSDVSDEASANDFRFIDTGVDSLNSVHVTIYSKNGMSYTEWLERDKELNKRSYNLDVVTVGSTLYSETENHSFAYYVTTYDLDDEYNTVVYDAFTENGDYVYNIAMFTSADNEKAFRTVLNSFKCETLDPGEVGIMSSSASYEDIWVEHKDSNIKFKTTLPVEMDRSAFVSSTGVLYFEDISTGVVISIDSAVTDPSEKISSITSYYRKNAKTLFENVKSVSNDQHYKIGKYSGTRIDIVQGEGLEKVTTSAFFTKVSNRLYSIAVSVPEIANGEKAGKIISTFMENFEVIE